MTNPRNRLVAITALAALLATPSMAFDEPVEIEGIIFKVDRNRVVLRTGAGERIVTIPQNADVVSVSGAFNSNRRHREPSVLLPGLPVKVRGELSGTDLVASTIEFKAKDYKTAVQIQAGVHETAASTAEVRSAVAQTGEFEVKEEAHVFFGVGSATISSEGKHKLLEFARKARLHQGYLISVLGYADPSGNAAANERLSNRRAQNVINFLKQNGDVLPGRVLAASAMGEVTLQGTGPAPTSYAGARRVTVRAVVSKVRLDAPAQP